MSERPGLPASRRGKQGQSESGEEELARLKGCDHVVFITEVPGMDEKALEAARQAAREVWDRDR